MLRFSDSPFTILARRSLTLAPKRSTEDQLELIFNAAKANYSGTDSSARRTAVVTFIVAFIFGALVAKLFFLVKVVASSTMGALCFGPPFREINVPLCS